MSTIAAATLKQVSRRRSHGYACGEETRLRIVRAAVELFGVRGYGRTSTRDIAELAEVNAAVLQYYFDGKEGLYLACAKYMHERASILLQPVLDRVKKRLESRVSRDDLIDCVCAIFEQAADFLLTHSEVEIWARVMAWDNLDRDNVPSAAREFLDSGIRLEFQSLLCRLVGKIIGLDPGHVETRARVVTLRGQTATFHMAREASLRDIGWSKVDARAVRLIKAVVRDQTRAALQSAKKLPIKLERAYASAATPTTRVR
jgi:AcrR family transcriptional regulator